MEPKKFKEVNIVFAENQSEYKSLPAFVDSNSQYGAVVTCWSLSFKERLRILFKGEMWLCLLSFNKPLTPSFLTTKKSEVLQVSESGK